MAKNGFKVVDAEPHFQEPYDLWEKYLPERYRSRLQVVPPPQGHLEVGFCSFEQVGDRLIARHARKPDGTLGNSRVWTQAMRRWSTTPHLAAIHEDYGTPDLYQEGFDSEGIDVGVLMPTLGGHVAVYDFSDDPDLGLAICQAYNDWAYAFTQADPGRFKFWGLIPPYDAAASGREARRCMQELGAPGVTIYGGYGKYLLNDEALDALWQELDALEAPIGFHGFGSGSAVEPGTPGHRRTDWIKATFGGGGPHVTEVRALIFGGLLDRFPHLKPVFMESGANGVPAMLEKLDDEWYTYGPDADFALEQLPSEYYKSRCYAVTYAEALLRQTIEYMGDDHLLFSSDYPHHDCPFPNGVRSFVELAGVTDESKRKILWDNAAKLFGLAS